MTETAAWKLPSEDAGSALPTDAKDYQNKVNAAASDLMMRAPIALTVTGTSALAGVTPIGATDPLPAYAKGLVVWWEAPDNCAGAGTTLAVDGQLPKDLTDKSANPLGEDAWLAGDMLMAIYDGARFRLLGLFDFDGKFGSLGMAPGYISGLSASSNATDGDNDIDIASGFARSEDNTRDIVLPAGLTKKLDEVWAQGTGAGAILQSANLAGTITVANASAAVAGTGTAFLTDYITGDVIQTAGGQARRITAVTSDTAMTAQSNFTAAEAGVTHKRGGKAPSSCYRIFLIRRAGDGAADVAVSTRDTPADLPAGWSKFARIGYVLAASDAKNRLFDSYPGGLVLLRSAIAQIDQAYSTTAGSTVIETVSTLLPPASIARIRIYMEAPTSSNNIFTVFPATLAAPTGVTHLNTNSVSTAAASCEIEVPLNAASAFKTARKIGGGGTDFELDLLGWVDPRGAGVGGIGSDPNTGRVRWPSNLTPAALAGDTDDYAPDGFATNTVLRVDYGAAGRKLTGLFAGADGDIVELDNVGTVAGLLAAEDAGSDAANRFGFTTDITHWPGQTVRLRYDGTAARWRTPRVGDAPGPPVARACATEDVDIAGGGLAAGQTADNVTLAAGDAVLLAHQAAVAENGLYTVPATGAAARAPFYRAFDAHPGLVVTVTEGSVHGGSKWQCVAAKGGTLGATPIPLVRAWPVPHQVAQPDPFPAIKIKPALYLDFANRRCLDDNLVFTGPSARSVIGPAGTMTMAAAGAPRFAFDPASGESRGLQLEPAATQLLLHSAALDNAYYTPFGLNTITADQAAFIDGTTSMDKIIEDGTTGQHGLQRIAAFVPAASTAYSLSSLFLKGTRSRARIFITNTFNGFEQYVIFDTDAGTIVSTGGTCTGRIYPADNERWRVVMTATSGASPSLCNVGLGLVSTGTTFNYAGDNASYIYAGGFQLELGGCASSYMPSIDAAVTRNQDALRVASLDAAGFNPNEGMIFIEAMLPAAGSNPFPALMALDDGTGNNRIVAFINDATGHASSVITTGGVVQSNLDLGAVAYGSFFKLALGWKAGEIDAALDGVATATDASAAIPAVTQLNLGAATGGSTAIANIFIKRVLYLPRKPAKADITAFTA